MEHRLIAKITIRASNQHGLITLAQLGDARRHPLAAPRHSSTTGGCVAMAPRVYGIAGAPASIDRRLMLGLLRLGRAPW